MTDDQARTARDTAVRHALADRVAADTTASPAPNYRRRIALMATVVAVAAVGIGIPVAVNQSQTSTTGPSATTPTAAPAEPNHRVPDIGNLLDRPTIDYITLASPDELAAIPGDVVVYGTITESSGSGDEAVLTVATEDGSQGHDDFETGDDVELVLTAFNDDTRRDVDRIRDELPPGTRVVAYGSPLATGSIELAGPQALAVQLAGSDQVFWPGMGSTTGDLAQALPGGTLVGPPIDMTSVVDKQWVLTERSPTSGSPPEPIDRTGSPAAWWEISSSGRLQYDAGCGTGAADVVPIPDGIRVIRIVEAAPPCDTTPTTALNSQIFADTFQASTFMLYPPPSGEPPMIYSPTGYDLRFKYAPQ